jgi:GH25 family lysozyme M1 (1,4-beta-N-acetylmuramidase)
MTTTSAQGRDYSADQPALTIAALAGLDFAFTKVTNGLTEVDPVFAVNWGVLGAWSGHRGGYHELVPGRAVEQAQFMADAVAGAGGFTAGDLLAVVASDYSGVTDADVKAFAGQLGCLAGDDCPRLVYTDLSTAVLLTESAAAYPLWVAWPSDTAPSSTAPWETWRFWQWRFGTGGGADQDSFNGTREELDAWVASYAQAPVPAESWEDKLMASIATVQQGSANAQAVKNWQGLLVARGYGLGTTGLRKDGVDGVFGSTTRQATLTFQAAAKVRQDGVVGPATWSAALAS